MVHSPQHKASLDVTKFTVPISQYLMPKRAFPLACCQAHGTAVHIRLKVFSETIDKQYIEVCRVHVVHRPLTFTCQLLQSPCFGPVNAMPYRTPSGKDVAVWTKFKRRCCIFMLHAV